MIHVTMLGPTVVRVDGSTVPESVVGGRRLQVLEILALNLGRPVPKEVLADQIWNGAPPPTYLGTLESYVCVLRKRLGLAGRGSSLATGDRGYVLGGPDVRVDLADVRDLAHEARTAAPRRRIEAAVEAASLVTGPLLAHEPYAEWAERAREAFDHELAETLAPVATLANDRGDHASARTVARAVVQRDRFCEVAWQELVRAHWLVGDRARALSTYARLRELLLDELGEQPSADSQRLYLAVLRSQDDGDRATVGQELVLLLRLMRQALEGVPGVVVPGRDAELVDVATDLVARERAAARPRAALA